MHLGCFRGAIERLRKSVQSVTEGQRRHERKGAHEAGTNAVRVPGEDAMAEEIELEREDHEEREDREEHGKGPADGVIKRGGRVAAAGQRGVRFEEETGVEIEDVLNNSRPHGVYVAKEPDGLDELEGSEEGIEQDEERFVSKVVVNTHECDDEHDYSDQIDTTLPFSCI